MKNNQFALEKAIDKILSVRKSCEEALEDDWDRSNEGFESMINELDEAIELLKSEKWRTFCF